MIQKEYYSILGLRRGASLDEIHAGYRRMALKWHPQRNPNNMEESMTEFQKVAEAYDVLSDVAKKSIYDEYGLQVFEQGTFNFVGYRYVGDPQVQFKTFFASDSAFVPLTQGENQLNMKPRELPRTKEEPLDLKLEVTLEELYTGVAKLVKFTRTRLAEDRITTFQEDATLTVEVGAGWANGTVVVYDRAGHQTHPGIQQGAVRLTVTTLPHQNLQRRGEDLVYTHRISLADALTGHVLHVTLLDHTTIAVPVPEIITSDDEKRVVGRGMAKAEKGTFGDLVVRFVVTFPKELTTAQKESVRSILAGGA